MLDEVPIRGAPMPPNDPLLYRFHELVMVNGPALKALIEEESATASCRRSTSISSSIGSRIQRDRVRLVMSGKLLPYEYYNAEQGVVDYGFKEE